MFPVLDESGSPQAMKYSMATTTQKNTLAALVLAAGLGPVAAQDAALETQIVDALNKVYGVHPGFRANHAKGVVAEGTFRAAPDAARLSKAVIFNGSAIPVTIRSRIDGTPESARRLPFGQSARNSGQIPFTERQRNRHGDQFAQILSGVGCGFPGHAARRGGKSACRAKADEAGAICGESSKRAARPRDGANARQLRQRRILRPQRLRFGGRRSCCFYQASLLTGSNRLTIP